MKSGVTREKKASPRKSMTSVRRRYLWGAALVILAILAYLPALRAGFVWDDDALTHNPLMRDWNGLKRIWIEPSAIPREAHYWPLVYTSFWIEYQIWGLYAPGYHFINILLHGINALLLWIILRRMKIGFACFAAAVFVLHPTRVESVAWVIERKDVLSGLFYLLSFLYFIRFDEDAKPGFYALSLLFFACGILSKSIVVSLPIALILYLIWKREKIDKRRIVQIAPYFILAIVLTSIDLWIFRQRTSARFALSFAERFIIAGRALWFYAEKTFFPHPLMAIYPRWEINAQNPLEYLYPLSAISLPVILYIFRRRIGIAPSLLVLYFGFTLFPVLGFVDYGYMKFSFVADRFQYLAGIGLIVLFASVIWRLFRNARSEIYYGIIVSLLIILGVKTFIQARTYRDYETLFRHNVNKRPDSWAAHNNLGAALEQRGDLENAVVHYKMAVELKPDEDQIHYNLGSLYARLKETDKAIFHYEEALKINPSYPQAHNNIGLLFQQKGDREKALSHLKESLRYRPNHSATYYNLARLLFETGDARGAARNFELAIRMNPGNTMAMNHLAWIYATHPAAEIRDAEKALKYASQACEMTGYKDPGILDTLAAAYAESGEFEKAVNTAKRAMEILEPSGDEEERAETQKRLELYQARQPFRERD